MKCHVLQRKILMMELSEHVEYCSSTTKKNTLLPQCLWPPNSAGWWLTVWNSHIVTLSFHRLILWDYWTNQICYISTSTRPIATKHGMIVTHCEDLPPIKLHDPLNIWLREDKRHIENTISPLPQSLWSHNMAESWQAIRVPIQKVTWSSNHVLLNEISSYQKCQGGDLPTWGASTHKVI